LAEEVILYKDFNLSQIIKAKPIFDVVGHYSRLNVLLQFKK
jgi:hypothetical protein